MHLCRFNHHSDFCYVAGTCYWRDPGASPIFRGPRSIKEGVVTVIEPPSSIKYSGAVTIAQLIVVSVHSTERRTVQIGARVASVHQAVS